MQLPEPLFHKTCLQNIFSVTPVTVSTKSKVFLKDFFSKFEDIGK